MHLSDRSHGASGAGYGNPNEGDLYWLYEKQLTNGEHVYENPVAQCLAGNKNGLFYRAYKKLSRRSRRAVVRLEAGVAVDTWLRARDPRAGDRHRA